MPDGSPMTEAPTRPTAPAEWTIAQVQAALSRPLPESMLDSKSVQGTTIVYLSWPTIADILDKYCPGWNWEIETTFSPDRIFVLGRLAIPTADGVVTRSATGTETLKREKHDRKTGAIELCEHAYGDPSSNAESMALRRCAAKFGLGRYLWKK